MNGGGGSRVEILYASVVAKYLRNTTEGKKDFS